MLDQNKGKVKVVFKHLPLGMHAQAKPAALAAIAAQNQGKFWQMHDKLFAAKGKLDQQNIEKMAADIGLDMEKFKKDLNDPATVAKMEKDIKDATKAGVSGTPSLFINGRPVTNRSPEGIKAMIEQEINKK